MTLSCTDLYYPTDRHHWGDGDFSSVITVRFPGERLFSTNSTLTYSLRMLLSRGWLHYYGQDWQTVVPESQPEWNARGRQVLALLSRDDRPFLGGELSIPQNVLAPSFAHRASKTATISHGTLNHVQYGFVHEKHHAVRQSLQVGSMLLKHGQSITSAHSLAEEEFWPTRLGRSAPDAVGIVPTDYPEDVDQTRAGRIELGVDRAGQRIVVAVPGTERGSLRPKIDSAGATLLELTAFLAQAGAVDAANLDGGGSTQLFYLGGSMSVLGNRYRMPGVRVERMIPSTGVLS